MPESPTVTTREFWDDEISSTTRPVADPPAPEPGRRVVSARVAAVIAVLALLVGLALGYAVSRPSVENANKQRDEARAQLASTADALAAARQDLDDVKRFLNGSGAANPGCASPRDLGELASVRDIGPGVSSVTVTTALR